MRYVADAGQMKEIDKRTSQELGIPPLVLMEKQRRELRAVLLLCLAGAGCLMGWKYMEIQ